MARQKSDLDVSRLCSAIQRSRQALRVYRENRVEAVRQYAGHYWSEEGTTEKVPVNLLALYVQVVGRNLIAKNPRVMLSTFERSLKPTVSAMESWANREIEHMRLANTLRRVVVDALFSVGVCKVALASPAESAAVAWSLGAGQPFAERVDLDDFVFDIHARDFSEVGFIGHRFRVPADVVRDSKLYKPIRKTVAASTDNLYNLEGDERIGVLGRGTYAGNSEDFEDYLDLWEIYLPRRRMILTLHDDALTGATGEPDVLREQGWLGPDTGPYHILGYGLVPGNAMPKAPVQDLHELHLATNRTIRKTLRMVERLKENTFISGGADEDGGRLLKADDGDIVRIDNPQNIKTVTTGGTGLQPVLGIFTTLNDLFSRMAGNLDMMGGLSPQSKTLGQDEMLEENASRTVSDMQDQTVDFAAGVLKALCWYWWHDPFKVTRGKHALPGLPEMTLQRQVTPAMRQRGRFEDLDVRIDPYSMKHSTPEGRLAKLNGIVQGTVIPMMSLMVQQGTSFDMNAYLQKVAQYLDQPDLADILTIAEPPGLDQPGSGASGGEAMKPPSTTRNYVRENRPSPTTQATNRNTVAGLMGVNPGGAHTNGQAGGGQ